MRNFLDDAVKKAQKEFVASHKFIKIPKVGDKVAMLEALLSGQCFRTPAGNIWKLIDDKPCLWSLNGDGWKESMFSFYSNCDVEYVEDPSIPPKPTLESLPAWTRCKVVLGCVIYDVVKMPGGLLQYHETYGVLANCNDDRVKLLSVHDAKTEQWEDV